MAEADVQERRREDLRQAAGVARVDAVGVERLAGGDEVDGLEHPHQREHRDDETSARRCGRCRVAASWVHGIGRRRAAAAHSVADMARPSTADPRAEAWEARFRTPIIVAALAVLPLLALSLSHPHGVWHTVEVAGHWAVWLTFASRSP